MKMASSNYPDGDINEQNETTKAINLAAAEETKVNRRMLQKGREAEKSPKTVGKARKKQRSENMC